MILFSKIYICCHLVKKAFLFFLKKWTEVNLTATMTSLINNTNNTVWTKSSFRTFRRNSSFLAIFCTNVLRQQKFSPLSTTQSGQAPAIPANLHAIFNKKGHQWGQIHDLTERPLLTRKFKWNYSFQKIKSMDEVVMVTESK